MDTRDGDSGLRLAELLAAFSLATDLGMGQPMDHVLRSWLIARRLCERVGMGDEPAAALYYVLVLAWVGCVADTTEVSTWFGDDIAFRGDSYQVDLAGLPMMGFVLSHVGLGAPFLHRVRLAASLALTGGRAGTYGSLPDDYLDGGAARAAAGGSRAAAAGFHALGCQGRPRRRRR